MLTEASGAVLRRERDVPLRKEPKRPATSAKASGGSSSGRKGAKAAAAELPEELLPAFEALRAWRAEQAREQGVPAYVIFHDATLREIATAWPTSVDQLGGISGVGEKKLVTYGEGVVAVLASLGGPPAGGAAAGATEVSAAGAGAGAAAGVGARTAAGANADMGPGSPDLWPDVDEEPAPEDWM